MNHERDQARPVRAAIVGSGFGGLAAAIRLQAAGYSTVLFEARDKPGGRAYVYQQEGFVFDAGPTVITAPAVFDELFELAGRRRSDYVEFIPVRPFYRLVWPDGDAFDYVGESEAMLQEIEKRNPEDARGYLEFVEYSRRAFAKGFEELAATPFLRMMDMLRVAPALAMMRADRSVYDAVASFVDDEHVRQALSFHALLVGGSPFETSAIYSMIHYLERNWGVFFARGGTGALVASLVRLYQELGGELRLSCPVTEIVVEPGRGTVQHLVTSARVTREPFDLVVSNADVYHTYATLYRSDARAQRTRRWLEGLDWSMSLFVLYFGTDRTYDLAHHTVLFGPRYRGLVDDIFHGDRLPEDFSLYLHYPTATDRSLSPPGCGTFYVLSPVPNLARAKVDWAREAGPYGDRILEALELHLPELRRHLVVRRHLTPEDFERELGAYQGAAFSLAPRLNQSAWFRPHNRDPRIPGLYLVGAGTHPGAGLPGVISSAKATCSVILQDYPVRTDR